MKTEQCERSLSLCNEMGEKFNDLFILIDWLEGKPRYLSINLPLDFQKSLIFFEITANFAFQLICRRDVIRLLNREPEEWQNFA